MFTACSDSKETVKTTQAAPKVLKVGMELAYPPFEMSDKQGDPSGVSVDMAYALGKHLGREVVIQNIAWDGLIPSLKTKKIDIIISSMTINDERKKTIDFSDPYAKSSLAILAGINSGVDKIADLNQVGKVVAVKKGSTGHLYAKDHLTNATVLVFDKESTCVLEVVQVKADAFIYDQLTIYKNWSKNQATTKAILASFQKDFEHWGIALRQNEPELKANINEFIAKAKQDKTFDELSYKYLNEARETFDRLKIPFFF
ncbi:MAG: transporter substrate-binding domain-containing protein [Campylobacterota bacterium]|nr:transporter substrate-binding domain-containing protein [Campylobacterota bacterium]